jgi:hypothetical protein
VSAGQVQPTLHRLGHIAVLAWISMLGSDVLLHAGILARLYTQPSPFLLDPARAFSRIPIGYLSFLVLTILLTFLEARLSIRNWRTGTRFGLLLGASIWLALVLGLASISTASWQLLAGWFVGQTVELGLAGAVVGAALQGVPMRRLWLIALGWCFIALTGTVLLQTLGIAPAALVHKAS